MSTRRLNVQHIESLNDVVAKITHVHVRETVPDSIIDRADEVELVDLTPEDLIQRLKEGKVYMPEQAERAIRNYFMPGNLTALARTCAPPHGAARRRADGRFHARSRHRRAVGSERARACLHQRASMCHVARALCAAPGGPAARVMERDPHRDHAVPSVERSGTRSDCRSLAPRAATGRAGGHDSLRPMRPMGSSNTRRRTISRIS